MTSRLVVTLIPVLMAVAAGPAASQAGQQKPAKIDWTKGTPVMPKKHKKGKVVEGPLEGPSKPEIKELAQPMRSGFGVILYWYWPGVDARGKAHAVIQDKVWTDKLVPPAITKGEFACIKVNARKCPKALFKEYRVGKFPMIQVYTCDGKVAKSFSGAFKDAKGFVRNLAAIARRNDAIRAKREKLRRKVAKEFARIEKLKESGKLDEARAGYAKLVKKHKGTTVAEDARWGIKEIKMIGIAAEGETLFKAGKYLAAKGRLSVVADFEMPCTARARARELMPECDAGIKYARAVALADKGDVLKAIEGLKAIVDDAWYDGPFQKKAAEKIKALRESWGK